MTNGLVVITADSDQLLSICCMTGVVQVDCRSRDGSIKRTKQRKPESIQSQRLSKRVAMAAKFKSFRERCRELSNTETVPTAFPIRVLHNGGLPT